MRQVEHDRHALQLGQDVWSHQHLDVEEPRFHEFQGASKNGCVSRLEQAIIHAHIPALDITSRMRRGFGWLGLCSKLRRREQFLHALAQSVANQKIGLGVGELVMSVSGTGRILGFPHEVMGLDE